MYLQNHKALALLVQMGLHYKLCVYVMHTCVCRAHTDTCTHWGIGMNTQVYTHTRIL